MNSYVIRSTLVRNGDAWDTKEAAKGSFDNLLSGMHADIILISFFRLI